MAYNRYKSFVTNEGEVKTVPFIAIPKRDSDKYTYWEKMYSRTDILSYKYYGSPDYGWLILQANSHLPSMEFMIDDGERIRIPFPLDIAISQYENDIKNYYNLESRA
jgi:hypothetical protein